ncbi:hypothetical protein AB0M83_22115 [Amycolatopsis sp. NPDC051106]|uniref:hypothetical protein n=1 Tax=unclassified Amycolatopsis TaxID=2618356 RepID=UPI00343A90E4
MTDGKLRVVDDEVDQINVVAPTRREGDPQVRLNLALAPAVAKVLKDYAARNGVTVTEAVRRAASLLDMYSTEVEHVDDADLAVAKKNTIRRVRFNWLRK